MNPIQFKQVNVTFAKDQPEYQPLPAFRTEDGQVVSCWRMTFKERLRVLFTGKVWLLLLTYNHPLQPQWLTVFDPFGTKAELPEVPK